MHLFVFLRLFRLLHDQVGTRYHDHLHRDWVLDLEKTLSLAYLFSWTTEQA